MAKAIPVTTGNGHTMEVTRSKGFYVVTIDGQESNSFKPSLASSFLVMHEDFPINMDGKEYVLAVRNSKVRLALSGRYVDNGENFKPSTKLPIWFWVICVIDLALLILGGALGGLLGAFAASISAIVARTEMPVVIRILLSVLLTIVAYVLWFVIAVGISFL